MPMVPDARARTLADKHGVSLKGIKSRRLSEQDFCKYDVIFAMDAKHLDSLQKAMPDTSTAKVMLFRQKFEMDQEIPDPYYGNLQGFERVYQLLLEATEQFLLDTEQRFLQQCTTS